MTKPPFIATFADHLEQSQWSASALCRGADLTIWFPERGGDTLQAKAICARCDVQAECLDYAIRTNEHHGVWGGLTERQRRSRRAATDRVMRCNICEAEFVSVGGQRKCSDECRVIAHRRVIAQAKRWAS